MSNKLRNVQAVKEMLQGTHKFQTKTTISFHDLDKKTVERAVGDIWFDDDGNEWEQKKGYKINKGKLSGLFDDQYTFKNCRKEVCTCKDPGRADLKMKTIHGMCLDCVVDMEHELTLDGKYNEYAQNKLKQNAMAWLRDSEQEVEELKEAVLRAPEFVNTDGSLNKWELTYNPEDMKKSIADQFEQVKQNIFTTYNITVDEFTQFKTK